MTGPVGPEAVGTRREIGRAGNIGLTIPFGATTPGLRSSVEVQRRILHRKVAGFGGLVTPRGGRDHARLPRPLHRRPPRGGLASARGLRGVLRLRARPLLGVGGRAARVGRHGPVEPVRLARLHPLLPVAHAAGADGRGAALAHPRRARRAPARPPLRVPVARRSGRGSLRRWSAATSRGRRSRARSGAAAGRPGPPAVRARVDRGRAAAAARAGRLVTERRCLAVRRPRAASGAARRPAGRRAPRRRRGSAARSRCCGGCTAATRPRHPEADSQQHAADRGDVERGEAGERDADHQPSGAATPARRAAPRGRAGRHGWRPRGDRPDDHREQEGRSDQARASTRATGIRCGRSARPLGGVCSHGSP